MCTQGFADMDEAFERLVIHREFASIEYQSFKEESKMPPGLEKHDVYLIQ